MTFAYRGETFAAELYYASGVETTAETTWTYNPALPDWTKKVVETEDEMRLNLAYIVAESISIGWSYKTYKLVTDEDATYYTPTLVDTLYDSKVTIDTTTMSVMASWRLMDMIYLAAGIENETMTMKGESALGTLEAVDNGWMNTVFGIGFVVGEPEDTQFRVEASMIQSPESKKDADGTKMASNKAATDTLYTSLEAKFADILISYRSKKEDTKKIGTEDEAVTDEDTTIGVGWAPMEGLTIMAYSLASKQTTKQVDPYLSTGIEGETVIEGTGYGLSVGYAF